VRRLASTRRRAGFTLIELMVAVALVVVFLTIVFSAVSATLRQRSMDQQLLIVEGNFSGACAAISQDVRAVGWPRPSYSGLGSAPLILQPAGKALDSQLMIVVPSSTGAPYRVRYFLYDFGDGSCQIRRGQAAIVSPGSNPNDIGEETVDPVTPRLPQIVRMIFANDGARVMITMVARITVNGYTREITYCDLVYPRNYSK